MKSVILTTPYLLAIGIFSILSILVILFYREKKITPFVSCGLITITVIISLFLGAELIEVLIYVLISFSFFCLALLRFKK